MINKNRLYNLFYSLLFLLLAGTAFGQKKVEQPKEINLLFRKIDLEDGLTGNRYNSFIFQDSKGFVWISSINGLNRFDGQFVKTYRAEQGLTGENIQYNFFEDKNSDIWFSTYAGINKYVRALDSLVTFPILNKENEPLQSGYRVICLDTVNSRLWFRVNKEVYSLNTDNPKEYKRYETEMDGMQFSPIFSAENGLEKLIAAPWFSQNGIEVFYFRDTQILEKKQLLTDLKRVQKSIHLEESKWLLFSEGKLILYDENQEDAYQIIDNPIEATFWDGAKIDNSKVFVSTSGQGLWIYNWRTDSFEKNWRSNPKNPNSLSSDSPREVYLINDYIWTSSCNIGVDYAYLFDNNFDCPLKKVFPNKEEIKSVAEDNNRRIWLATEEKGVVVLNENGEQVVDNQGFNAGFKNNSPWQVRRDESGNMFIVATKEIFHILSNGKRGRRISNPQNYSFRCLNIVYPNRILVSTTEGIKELVKEKSNNFKLKDCEEFKDISEFDFLQIYSTQTKTVYIPYKAAALWIYRATAEGLKLMDKKENLPEFYNFFESKISPNTVWAATAGGLYKITNDTTIQPIIVKNDRITLDAIYNVIEDSEGRLWLGTNMGLFRFSPESKELLHFDKEDGISGNVFSMYDNGLVDSEAHIWLGNNNCGVRFDPQKITAYPKAPKIYFDKLTINNQTKVDDIDEKTQLILENNQNTLLFEIASIGFYKPEKTKITYRLTNYEDEWLTSNIGEPIRFTKIPKGEYVFEIKAENAAGVESAVRRLDIKIKAPFWDAWYFYVLYALMVAALAYAIYRFRIGKIREAQAKETALVELERQVAENELKALRAQMNPHFLFNAMNSIKSIIIKQESNQAIVYLTKFSNLLRTILSNSEKKSILLKSELEALELYIELEALRFKGSFKSQINVDRTVDKSYVRIPPLILQPFVENAIWHGLMPKSDKDNKLILNIFRKNDFVLCEIEDNGIGRKQAQALKENKKHDSMGIGITEKRIKMLHKDNEVFIVDLEDGKGQGTGTKVIVKIFAPD